MARLEIRWSRVGVLVRRRRVCRRGGPSAPEPAARSSRPRADPGGGLDKSQAHEDRGVRDVSGRSSSRLCRLRCRRRSTPLGSQLGCKRRSSASGNRSGAGWRRAAHVLVTRQSVRGLRCHWATEEGRRDWGGTDRPSAPCPPSPSAARGARTASSCSEARRAASCAVLRRAARRPS